MYIYFYLVPLLSIVLIYDQNLLGILFIITYIIYSFATFILIITSNLLWYERLTKTENINTIKVWCFLYEYIL